MSSLAKRVQLDDLVEHCTGLATCEDGGGVLSLEIMALAEKVRNHPAYRLLAAVVAADDARVTHATASARRGVSAGAAAEAKRAAFREAVEWAEAVGLASDEEDE